jgi:putative methanogenesis marker protein 8
MTAHKDEHIIEAIGKCRVVVCDGKVVEVGKPIIADCPLAKRFAFPVPEITPEAVKANIEHRIRAFGMCTPAREVLDSRPFVGFGASELISFGIQSGMLDAAVVACDGAGTVVATLPEMVQGIGGRMSGLVSTSPYPSVIERIEQNGGHVLDPINARMDQQSGVALAHLKGFRRIAVTVALPEDAEAIRAAYPGSLIVAVHVSGLSRVEAARLVGASDMVTSCASKPIREIAGPLALVQAGISIPVFAMTPAGKSLIIEKIRASSEPVLIKPTKLPVTGDREPSPLV